MELYYIIIALDLCKRHRETFQRKIVLPTYILKIFEFFMINSYVYICSNSMKYIIYS